MSDTDQQPATHEYIGHGGGTEPDADEQHRPRRIAHVVTLGDGTEQFSMMSEIGDGTFVQWTTCARCHKGIGYCICAQGPQEPAHIATWRERRFVESFTARGAEPALPVNLKQRDRRVNGVIRHLLNQGWTVAPPTPEAPEYDPTMYESDDAEPHDYTREYDESRPDGDGVEAETDDQEETE